MAEFARRNYLLAVLLLVLAFNYVDRLAFGLLLQDIKTEFALTDTQLGFLTGIAFALFYSVMGIPIARWADRGNRVKIITCTTALWSLAVALCGAAAGFWQLLLIRIGVAVGEAGCLPPAHSLIADHFNRAERPRAVARYMLGVPLSMVIGYFIAGWLNEFYGWRTTFLLLGLPGLGLAALVWFTLNEPRCAGQKGSEMNRSPAAVPLSQPTLKEVCTTLWASHTFRNLLLCFSVVSFFGYGIAQWKSAFFMRSFHLRTGELGTWFSLIYGLGGFFGTYLGGELAARYAVANERLQLKGLAVVYTAVGVLSVLIYLSPNARLAFFFLTFVTIGLYMSYGPLFATIQTLVPDRMRAMSIALIYLFANLIGMGLGPWAAGAMSDAFRPWAGDESLRYALLALSPGYLWAAWHLLRSSRTVAHDLKVQVHSCVI